MCLAVAALLPVDDRYAERFVMEVMSLEGSDTKALSQKEVGAAENLGKSWKVHQKSSNIMGNQWKIDVFRPENGPKWVRNVRFGGVSSRWCTVCCPRSGASCGVW